MADCVSVEGIAGSAWASFPSLHERLCRGEELVKFMMSFWPKRVHSSIAVKWTKTRVLYDLRVVQRRYKVLARFYIGSLSRFAVHAQLRKVFKLLARLRMLGFLYGFVGIELVV